MSLLFHERRRMDEDLVDALDQRALFGRNWLFDVEKRIFIGDVVTTHVVRHQIECPAELRLPHVRHHALATRLLEQPPRAREARLFGCAVEHARPIETREPRFGCVNRKARRRRRGRVRVCNRFGRRAPFLRRVVPHHVEIL
jgi:hypothetical protein